MGKLMFPTTGPLFLRFIGEPLLGFDRMVAILCNASSIRDVIAFLKTSAGTDALLKSPTPVPKDILDQYGIQPR